MGSKDMSDYINKVVEPKQTLEKVYCSFFENMRNNNPSMGLFGIDSIISLDSDNLDFSVIIGREDITALASIMKKTFLEQNYAVMSKDSDNIEKVYVGALNVNAKDETFYGTTIALKNRNDFLRCYTYNICTLKISSDK